jgi:predicted Zn finger-like uncharacterized protein
MKISCVSCSAQYSLADEKVAGRSFKTRCKKCGAPIVVRAEQPAGDVMTGARNESSLLFSIHTLAQTAQAVRPATTDGSGLVDIKKLAAAIETKPAKKDDADLFATYPAAPLAAPVIIAPVASKKGAPTLAIVTGLCAGAVVAALAGLVVAIVIVGGQTGARADVPRPATEPIVIVPPAVAPIVRPAEPDPLPAQIEPPAPPVDTPVVSITPRPRPRPPIDVQRPPQRPVVREDETFEDITSELAPEPRTNEPREQLPQAPSRADVLRAMESVARQVRTCGGGANGMASTRIVFSGQTGRVTDAAVTGGTLPPEARSCIARTVRSASVPRFTQRTFSVTYPFSL